MFRIITSLFLLLLAPTTSAQVADMPGAGDHEAFPRVTESVILGFAASDYEAGTFLAEDADGKLVVERPEGVRTRILYLNPTGVSPLSVQKNYEAALADVGDVEEVLSCSAGACSGHQLATRFWTRESMVPTHQLSHPYYLLGFSHNFTNPAYRYARVVSGASLFHVGVLSATVASNNPNESVRERTVTLVEILEVSDFEPTLEFVDAAQMRAEIAEAGRVALYGIQFDHDQATLKPESDATLDEIAKVLSADASMAIYVVGHTDDVGALDYNQALSRNRAQAVVDALVGRGVDGGRLTAIGVGPASPVGRNETEAGRALNRRVELVRRVEN